MGDATLVGAGGAGGDHHSVKKVAQAITAQAAPADVLVLEGSLAYGGLSTTSRFRPRYQKLEPLDREPTAAHDARIAAIRSPRMPVQERRHKMCFTSDRRRARRSKLELMKEDL